MIGENKTVDNQPSELDARLDRIEGELAEKIENQEEQIRKQGEVIEGLKKNSNVSSDDEDEGILVDRKSAHTMKLPVVEGVPVIEGKSERVIGVEGLEYVIKVETADGGKYTFPLGGDVSKINFNDKKLKDIQPTSYENLPTKDFALQNIDENDLTGASKVKKGKIIGEGGVINEVDRSGGTPVKTGRKIRTVVRADIRDYTIEFNGENYTISNKMLGNIRV